MNHPLDITFIESFDGGSHRAFREGLAAHSCHRYRALTLPDRAWKWRMRSAAAWFARQLADDPAPCDLILVTSLLDVAGLRGLLPPPLDRVPLVLYMHENQLTYPPSPHEKTDLHFGFTNISSCLAADRVVFNSAFHREAFLEAVPRYLARMPDAVPPGIRQRLADGSEVLPVGLDRPPLPAGGKPVWRGGARDAADGPAWPRGRHPLVVWNHRWEYDKRPDLFAAAVGRLLDMDLEFDVVLLGDGRDRGRVFAPLIDRLGPRCLHAGYLEDRRHYDDWLAAGDIVVSCAEQENFGISVAEAVHAGCYPVLPRRQVYPELYGPLCPGRHLYDDDDDLTALLAELIRGDGAGHRCSLATAVDEFCWPRLAPRYDQLLHEAAVGGGKVTP